MRLATVGFFIGILLLQKLPDSPWLFTISIVPLFYLFYRFYQYRLLWAIALGFFYVVWAASTVIDTRLIPSLEGENILVQGVVSSIPYQQQNARRFQLLIDMASLASDFKEPIKFQGKLKVTWYRSNIEIKSGERWQLLLRLKRPSGFMNPGGLDYEKWLFSQRIVATGYVRDSELNQKISDPSLFSINSLREKVANHIKEKIPESESRAIILALAIADRTEISDSQWTTLRQTGTNHLVAISGLHIGLVAGFAFIPVWLLGWLYPLLYQRIPARIIIATLGASLAVSYALLAGLTLPTQRALIMVLVALLAIVLKRKYSLSTIYFTALFAVLLFDPLAVLSMGFWLSFLAVGLIVIAFRRRIQQPRFSFIGIQLVLSLGMLPLLLGVFGSASLSAPLANLLAIPWVSFVTVPLVLLSILTLPVDFLATFFLQWAGWSIDLLFQGLGFFSSSDFMFKGRALPTHLLMIVSIGMLWLLLPRRFPARWLGLILLIPLWTYQAKPMAEGAFRYDMLDVGQGLASVIRTTNHVLIYDTGPRSRSGFDTGKLVVLPFLQSEGIQTIDQLIISHEDLDHRGGAKAIIAESEVLEIMSSDITLFPNTKKCQIGQQWHWDGVDFEILSPPMGGRKLSDNNKSCVLRVSNQYHSLLLTGDIQRVTEKVLLKQEIEGLEKLSAEVMQIPHHGSKTSSQRRFIDAVNPTLALVSVGYRNRFHLPNQEVVRRYNDRDIQVLSTVEMGAISVFFPQDEEAIEWEGYRQKAGRYWHR
ncbi:MAG: DNA internalization-related competence protein ComEC/Rec2 [Thiotrichaceae bacterium]|nr:DNA internalization-related competence protein ComEC/Rec2 [Thiotrichaceae bacterium]